jgi:amino acid transporter
VADERFSEPPKSRARDTRTSLAPEDHHGRYFTFAGWGRSERITDLHSLPEGAQLGHIPHGQLSEWRATAICGNDITSSVLYVVALCTMFAGIYAPIALALVGLVLYLFRKIYAEVGTALPLNGGAYNVLLNTTSKYKASMAACLTLLSYIATAVISSTEALHYLHSVFEGVPVLWGSVALLAFFAILNIVGITESSTVALAIFIFHTATLMILIFACIGHATFDNSWAILQDNLKHPPPKGILYAVFFGFAAALLGISGFESSANFIEEQKPGVFPKTLRNMWIAVFFFNVSVSILAISTLPINQMLTDHAIQETLLAEMGHVAAGEWLGTLIGIDAFLVLSGAVLTSYVGVTGLVRRMSLDRCLPQFLLKANRFRGTQHWITISFFALSVSILVIIVAAVGREGVIEALAGVYTLSFLGVMGLFVIGNRLLALKRAKLPRAVRASWPAVVVAFIAVLFGIAGNVLKRDPFTDQAEGLHQALIFLLYFVITAAAVTIMFARMRIMRGGLYIGRAVLDIGARANARFADWLMDRVESVNSQSIVFFTRGDGPANLRRAIEYVIHNEHTRNLKVVNVYTDERDIPPQLAQQLKMLDGLFPEIRIDFLAVKGKFGPEMIDSLSVRLGVPRNYMFIGCPGDRFPHNIEELGGVRLIV